jgi:hypothetical protein
VSRRLSVILLACVAALAGAPGVALAQGDGTTFLFQPGYGPAGTVITMHGTGCVANGQAYDYAAVRFYAQSDEKQLHPKVDKRYDIKTDGTFDAKLVVPKLPPATYRFVADCYRANTPYRLVLTTFLVQGGTASPAPSGAATSSPPKSTASTKPGTARPSSSAPAAVTSTPTATTVAAAPRSAVPTTTAAKDGGSSRAPLVVVALLALAGVGVAAGRRFRTTG